MNDSILKQLTEVETLANKYQEELGQLRIGLEGKSTQFIANKVLSLLALTNEMTPKLTTIQNQINHAKNNRDRDNLRAMED